MLARCGCWSVPGGDVVAPIFPLMGRINEPFMTSLWSITNAAGDSCNLLEIDLLRPFPCGDLGGWVADTRTERLWVRITPS